MTYPLHWIILLPLIGAVTNLLLGRFLPRWLVTLVACGSVGAACVIAVDAIVSGVWTPWHGGAVHPVVTDHFYTWIQSGSLTIGMNFVLDPLSAVMVFTVTFIGFLIHVYSSGYMAHDKRYSTYFAYLNLFTASMLILVLGDSLPILFIGWEGVGVCSYLLIGFWFQKTANADAGRKAFVTNRIGDFGFLLGIFLLWSALTSARVDNPDLTFQWLSENGAAVLHQPLLHGGNVPAAFWIGLLLFVGAAGKSAQIPLYVWLPDAMAGPTPVSALIHAATMVTAGVYMVARMGFLYAIAPQALMVVAGVGAATALFAAAIGFAQNDIKKVLAYSTVSQLGFMFVGVAASDNSVPGIFHLMTHAWFKAGLFLGAGSVMHAMSDSTDIMKMGGLAKKIPITHITFLIYCLAITGIPPFAGFWSKDDILAAAYHGHAGWPHLFSLGIWAALSVAALGTAFYMWRLYFLVFWGKSRADAKTQEHIHESPPNMTVPLIVLAIGAFGIGFVSLPTKANFLLHWIAGRGENEVANLPLMAIATAAGVVGIAGAWFVYKDGPERAGQMTARLGGLRTAAAHKFYVDELYDFALIRPFRAVSNAIFQIVDRFLIDTVLVDGSAWVVDKIGRVARRFQNGDVQRYLLAMVLGGAGIFFFMTRAHTDFETKQRGGTDLQFVPEIGDGIERQDAKLAWDFGDGQPSNSDAQPTHHFQAPGEYRVRLDVTDVFGTHRTVRKTIQVAEDREP